MVFSPPKHEEGILCLRQLQSLGIGLVLGMAGFRCSSSASVSLFWLNSQLSLYDSRGATSNWKHSSLSQVIPKKKNLFTKPRASPKVLWRLLIGLAWITCLEMVASGSKTSLLARTESHAHLWGHNLCALGFWRGAYNFVEIEFMYYTIHLFKVYKSRVMVSSIFPEFFNHHPDQF